MNNDQMPSYVPPSTPIAAAPLAAPMNARREEPYSLMGAWAAAGKGVMRNPGALIGIPGMMILMAIIGVIAQTILVRTVGGNSGGTTNLLPQLINIISSIVFITPLTRASLKTIRGEDVSFIGAFRGGYPKRVMVVWAAFIAMTVVGTLLGYTGMDISKYLTVIPSIIWVGLFGFATIAALDPHCTESPFTASISIVKKHPVRLLIALVTALIVGVLSIAAVFLLVVPTAIGIGMIYTFLAYHYNKLYRTQQ